MREKAPERCAIRKQDGVVVEPESSTARYGTSAGTLVELNEHRIVIMCREKCAVCGVLRDFEPQHLLVPRQRPFQIGYLETHTSEMSLGGQTIALRSESIGKVARCLLDCAGRRCTG